MSAEKLLAALREIAKAEGAYSRDPLKHAENVIDNMVEIAEKAIAEYEAEPTPTTDEGQSTLFDLPAPKPRNAVAEGR